MVFGDGLNDTEMIEHVGTGVAMGKDVQELIKVAGYVTDDADKHGLVKGMNYLGLLK
ncbi:HAD hydrolase family protein [Aquibacillus saliphilus]|uniref:HAD hydrolase family protein n=1 Tax=Aquibacillus saliphilus TaxID=1909422 RepID=UPI001CF075BB|nr:HAD hydrolase family protein [Aquibacillus saliphilus]